MPREANIHLLLWEPSHIPCFLRDRSCILFAFSYADPLHYTFYPLGWGLAPFLEACILHLLQGLDSLIGNPFPRSPPYPFTTPRHALTSECPFDCPSVHMIVPLLLTLILLLPPMFYLVEFPFDCSLVHVIVPLVLILILLLPPVLPGRMPL